MRVPEGGSGTDRREFLSATRPHSEGEVVHMEDLTECERGLVEEYIVRLRRIE